MSKNKPLYIRLDDYTDSLLTALVNKSEQDKSKVVRAAIDYYANYVLGQDEVNNLKLYNFFEGN